MTRVKRGYIRRKRRQRKFKIVKGTANSILLKKANQQYLKAYQNAFIDRRLRKRYFRSLWICRMNAKIRQFGLNYHSLSQKLKRLGFDLGLAKSASNGEANPAILGASPKETPKPSGKLRSRTPAPSADSLGRVSSSLVHLSYFNRKILAQLILHDFSLFNNLNIQLRSNQ